MTRRRRRDALSRALSELKGQARGFTRALESALSRDTDPWTRRNARVLSSLTFTHKSERQEEGGLDALEEAFTRQGEPRNR